MICIELGVCEDFKLKIMVEKGDFVLSQNNIYVVLFLSMKSFYHKYVRKKYKFQANEEEGRDKTLHEALKSAPLSYITVFFHIVILLIVVLETNGKNNKYYIALTRNGRKCVNIIKIKPSIGGNMRLAEL